MFTGLPGKHPGPAIYSLFFHSRSLENMDTYSGFRSDLQALVPRLWRFALALTREYHSAQDLVQSTCLRALERHHQFEAGSRLDYWVFRIARSVWLNELRRQQVRAIHQPLNPDELAASGCSPDQAVLQSEVFTQVMALPEPQRLAIVLIYVEGFSYAEASNILDIPVGTVMSRLATARRKLSNKVNASSNVQSTSSALLLKQVG